MVDRRRFKSTNLFLLLFQTIEWELRTLNQYIQETAKVLKDKQTKLEDDFNKAKQEKEENHPMFDFYFPDEFDRYHRLFPTYTFNSLLVTQFSFLELYLREVCEMCERQSFSKVKLSDLNGPDIDKCRKYLILIAELNFDPLEKIWQKFKFIQQLRNSTVHHSSKIENTQANNNLINHIKKEKSIEFDTVKGEFFINDIKFLESFSTVIHDFFKHLTDILSKDKVIARNQVMPYNNAEWGKEKALSLLEDIVTCVELLNDIEAFEHEDTVKEKLGHLYGKISRMTWNSTKIFAFFSNAKWEIKDREAIMSKGRKGLDELKKIYE